MKEPPVPPPPTPSPPPTESPSVRRSYGAVADANIDLYTMLHLDPRATLNELEEALREALRWWNGQQANPKYRAQAAQALARLRETRETLLDPIRRQEYDRTLQAFRRSYREVRWQPVRDLADLLLEEGTCTPEQQLLLVRFAQKRGLATEEIQNMLNEEFLRRSIELIPSPAVAQELALPTEGSEGPRPSYKLVISLLTLSLLGLFILPFYQLGRPAVLLLVPFLNDLRLLVRNLHMPRTPGQDKTNGWDWAIGAIVLGGATLTALFDSQSSPLFPLPLVVTGLIWFAWLRLVILWQKTPPSPPALPDPDPKPSLP